LVLDTTHFVGTWTTGVNKHAHARQEMSPRADASEIMGHIWLTRRLSPHGMPSPMDRETVRGGALG
jgi:hypothetical protein